MSLDLEREQTVQLLCRQFALDRISEQELETRLDAAYRARSSDELNALVASLPPVPMSTYERAPVTISQRQHVPPEERHVYSIFSSVKKRGDWEPGEEVHATTIFGELVLDFREARLRPGLTTVHISAVFGTAKIIVPPGLHIECDGSAFMGEFTQKTSLAADPGADAPTLRIVGNAFMANVDVRMRLPDETALQALKREWGR